MPVIFLKVLLVLIKFTETVSERCLLQSDFNYVKLWAKYAFVDENQCGKVLDFCGHWLFGKLLYQHLKTVSEPWSVTFEQCNSNQIQVNPKHRTERQSKLLTTFWLKAEEWRSFFGSPYAMEYLCTQRKWHLLQRQTDWKNANEHVYLCLPWSNSKQVIWTASLLEGISSFWCGHVNKI